jgi:hypothetical protein
MRLSHMRSAATVAHPTVEPLALDGLPSSDRTQRRHPAKRRHHPLTTDTVLMIVGPIAAFIGAWFGGWCAERRKRR